MKASFLLTKKKDKWYLAYMGLFDYDWFIGKNFLKDFCQHAKIEILSITQTGIYFLDNLTGFKIKK